MFLLPDHLVHGNYDFLSKHSPTEFPVVMEMFYICAFQYGSYEPYAAIELLKCLWLLYRTAQLKNYQWSSNQSGPGKAVSYPEGHIGNLFTD